MIYARIHYKATCIIHHTADFVVSGLFQACPKKKYHSGTVLAIDPLLTISTREKRKVMVSISGRSFVTNWSVHIYFTLAIIRPFFSFENKNKKQQSPKFSSTEELHSLLNRNSQFGWIHKTSFFFLRSTNLQGNKEILQDHSK